MLKFKKNLLHKAYSFLPLPKKMIKSLEEFRFWKENKAKEVILSNSHYEYFYTKHFHLNRDFYNGKRILDIGCGPRGSLEWADMALERVGLDPLVGKYKNLGINRHKMKYILANAEKIPFSNGYFDVVFSFNSLDHTDILDKTIKSIIRVIKQGGIFLLITEVNHPATLTESIVFSWDIVKSFSPELSIIEETHYEKTALGIYESISKGVLYNHENLNFRSGILSVKFEKQN